MLQMKFFRSYYPIAGLKKNPYYLTKEKAETLCMGNAETLTFINTIFTSSLSFKDSIKEKKLWSKEWVVPHITLGWIICNMIPKNLCTSENSIALF